MRSVVSFSVSLIKMTDGISIQTILPIVDPTIPSTFSMSGVLMPTIKVMIMMPAVIPFDLYMDDFVLLSHYKIST